MFKGFEGFNATWKYKKIGYSILKCILCKMIDSSVALKHDPSWPYSYLWCSPFRKGRQSISIYYTVGLQW